MSTKPPRPKKSSGTNNGNGHSSIMSLFNPRTSQVARRAVNNQPSPFGSSESEARVGPSTQDPDTDATSTGVNMVAPEIVDSDTTITGSVQGTVATQHTGPIWNRTSGGSIEGIASIETARVEDDPPSAEAAMDSLSDQVRSIATLTLTANLEPVMTDSVDYDPTAQIPACDNEETATRDADADVEGPSTAAVATSTLDLLSELRDTYRLLELYQEQGSGGLVEKVLIDQNSVIGLANAAVSGSAGPNISRVDFAKLDNVQIKIVGVYGDQEQLVRLLQARGIVNENTAKRLLSHDEEDFRLPALRPGLYLSSCETAGDDENGAIVFFWPEKTTWKADVMTNVVRNRVTFMRYLTQLTDQIYCVTTKDQIDEMRLDQEAGSQASTASELDGRSFVFQVEETNALEEEMMLQPDIRRTSFAHSPDTTSIPSAMAKRLLPQLITGHKNVGLLTARFIPAYLRKVKQSGKRMWSTYHKSIFKDETYKIVFDPEAIYDIDVILENQLYPNGARADQAWVNIRDDSKTRRDIAQAGALQVLQEDYDPLTMKTHQTAVEIVLRDLSNHLP